MAIRQLERPPPARPGLIRPPVREFEGPTTLPELGIVGGEELGPLEVGLARLGLLELVHVFGDLHVGLGPQGTDIARPQEMPQRRHQMQLRQSLLIGFATLIPGRDRPGSGPGGRAVHSLSALPFAVRGW